MFKKKQHGHHGGAWKVAYADFVTAMMALFLVLWLTAQDEKIKEAVERSFKNPFTSVTKESTGIIPNKETQAVKDSSGNFDSQSAVELQMLRRMAEDLLRTLQSNAQTDDSPVKLELVPEGVKISVFDRAHRPVFIENTAEFTEYGRWIFSTLAWQIAGMPKAIYIELEGHAEKGGIPRSDTYGSWEVTADRANQARRTLLKNGAGQAQIRKVSGYADTMPMPNLNPTNEVNRRVTVMLRVKADTTPF